MEKIAIKPSSFRAGVKWLGALLLFHLGAFLAYSLLMVSIVKSMYDRDNDHGRAFATILVFQCVFWLLVAFLWVARGEMSYSENRRLLLNASREEGFSPLAYFFRQYGVRWLWRTAFYAAFQLPFTFFFNAYGLIPNDSITFIEKWYIADAGFYGITGSAIAGFLLSTLYFFFIMVFCSLIKFFILLRQK